MALQTLTADGTTEPFAVHNSVVSAYGTFGGGTLTLRKKVGQTFYAFIEDDAGTKAFEATSDGGVHIKGNHTCDFSLDGATSPNIVCGTE